MFVSTGKWWVLEAHKKTFVGCLIVWWCKSRMTPRQDTISLNTEALETVSANRLGHLTANTMKSEDCLAFRVLSLLLAYALALFDWMMKSLKTRTLLEHVAELELVSRRVYNMNRR